jgi:hypothetical protein
VPATDDDDFGVTPSGDSTVRLAVGETTKIPLVGWSLAPGAEWSLSVVDATGAGALNAALDRKTANDGTAFSLTLAWNKTPATGSSTVLVRSKRGTHVEAWPILVATP